MMTNLNFSWQDMRDHLEILKDDIQGATFLSIQSLRDRSFLFHLKKQDTVRALLVSVEDGFMRFHLSRRKGRELPENHPFKKLIGATLVAAFLSDRDRILTLQTEEFTLFICLIPKKGNLYFSSSKKGEFFALNQKTFLSFSINFKKMKDKNESIPKENQDEFYRISEESFDFELKKAGLLKQIEKLIAGKKKLIQQLKNELAHCQSFDLVRHVADLLKANLFKIEKNAKEVEVQDWQTGEIKKLTLDPLIPLNDVLKARYQKAKRLERGIPQLLRKIEKEEKGLFQLNEELEHVNSASFAKELSKYGSPEVKKETKTITLSKKDVFKRFVSKEGFEILVGTSAKNNDRLTFTIAKGKDLFLHAADSSGAHVIVRLKKKIPGQPTLEEAALLAIHFSRDKHSGKKRSLRDRMQICKKSKRKEGAVFLMQKKTRWVHYEEARVKLLLKELND